MRSLVFFYNNQWQSGTLLKSQSRDPQYYWFFFDSHLFPGEVDQYLSFVCQDGKVATTKTYDAQFQPMIESIQKQVENLLAREKYGKGTH